MLRFLAIALLVLSFAPLHVGAQNDRSLSPYFVVNVDSGESVPDFPLKSTSANVEISGVVANVTITQVYTNHSARALEAVYVFPASTNAAVYAMEMRVGRRVIEAHIMEKRAARETYNEAKAEGKTTSLLEQQRPNVFTMNVANVMPGDSIVVNISYTERLVPTDGVYEFVYPTVVAPRYTGAGAPLAGLGDSKGTAGEIPYTKKGVKPGYTFGINISVASGIPFEFIRSTTHKVLLSFGKENAATVQLDESETSGGDRDFVLQYRFRGGKIETGLMLYEGKDENFFMLMMEPPKRVPVDSIPPREYIFVMDVSGSMSGYPLETSKQLLRNLVGGLRPVDKFNVIQFAGGGALMAEESVQANAANIDSAIAFIDRVQAGGGTELNNAMRTAMFIPQPEGYSRSIVIVTDGLISAEAGVLRSMRNHLDSANVFAFGIGSSCNRYLIEAMAFCGNGEPFVVMKEQEADSAAEKFRRYISSPVLSGIRIQYNGFDAYDTEPVAVPDLFASRPLVITGKYRGKATGTISITGTTGAGLYSKVINVDSVHPRKQNKAISLLWARDRVRYLGYLDRTGSTWNISSGDTAIQQEITALGLKYSLLTNYTSFVAVDRRERNKDPQSDSLVPVPLPLPSGMDNSAVGMMGSLNTVTITGMQGVVDVSYSCCSTIARCEILPSRPVFSGIASALHEPAAAGDINRVYNGGFINPVLTNRVQPFFTAGASGRMLSLLPTEMLGTYALGATGGTTGVRLSPINTGTFGFNSWLSPGAKLTLSATHRGTQNLYFSHARRLNNRFHSSLEIAEQWKGVATDRNDDGYEDLSTGFNVSAHHLLKYDYSTPVTSRSRTFTNEIYFHTTAQQAGQDVAGGYAIKDNSTGVYIAQRGLISTRHDDYLDMNISFALASMENGWGVDRFHLNTMQLTGAAEYEWRTARFTFNTGIDGWASAGDERWNAYRLSAAHQSAGAFASTGWRKENWFVHGSVRAQVNDIGGATVLPSLRTVYRFGNSFVELGASRYRDMPFAIGQLLPLFFSSRELEVDEDPGLNQGWNFRTSLSFFKNDKREISGTVTYQAILPEHSVLVDVDSDAGTTRVYGMKGGPLMHRGILKLNVEIVSRLRLEGEYVMTITPGNYKGSILQQPLLPLHRGYATLAWKNSADRFHAQLQACYTGAQRLPQAGWSPDYATVSVLMKYRLRERITVFGNAFNILDYRQQQLVTTTNGNFDGWQMWAPLNGRTFQVGVTVSF